MATVPGNDWNNTLFCFTANLQNECGNRVHHSSSIKTGANDHYGDDRHHGVTGETSEQILVVYQPLLKSHPGCNK